MLAVGILLRGGVPLLLLLSCHLVLVLEAQSSNFQCSAEREEVLLPTDSELCAKLEEVVRNPSDLPLDEYESKLGDYLQNFCHRNARAGWKRDKRVRDTGPYTVNLQNGERVGKPLSLHGLRSPYAAAIFSGRPAVPDNQGKRTDRRGIHKGRINHRPQLV